MSSLQNRKNLISAVYTLFVLCNFALNTGLLGVDAYALILGLVIIYSIKWETPSELLYYFVLLCSVMDFSFNLPLLGRFNIYYLHIALFILTISMIRNYLRNRPLPSLKAVAANKYSLFLVIFIVYMILSLAWAQNRGMGFKYMINYAIMICFMLAVYTFNPNREKVKETLKVLLYTAIPVLIIGSLEMMGMRMPVRNIFSDNNLYPLAAYLRTIPTVFFYNPNNYGVYLIMVMSFIISLIAYNRTNRLLTALLWVIQIAALLNLIFCTSRTAYIVMLLTLVGFFLFFLATKEWSKFRRVLAIGLTTLIIFYGLSFLPNLSIYYGKFNDTPLINKLSLKAKAGNQPIAEFAEGGSTSERWTIIVDIFSGVLKNGHPQGFGVDNTAVYLKSKNNTHGIVNPHSLWFEVLGDFGVGIFLYLIFIYLSLLWDLRKVYLLSIKDGQYGLTSYLAISLLAALGGFILTAFAPSTVISFSQMWLLYGLAASVIIRQKDFLKNPAKTPLE